ncbi:hypothetical protein [Nocardia panacis]|nr:hypothetical protein [Nocardia panacis]
MIEQTARQFGYRCEVLGPDEVRLILDGDGFVMALANLRRIAAVEERDEWPALVADHMSTGIAAFELDQESPIVYRDFDEVRALVRTRLYPSGSPANGAVRRFIAPGLAQRVVFDSVNAVHAVTYDMLREWPIGERDLFALAEANVRADGRLEIQRADFADPLSEGLPISVVGGSEYATAQILWLDRYPELLGAAGALFVIPTKRPFFTYPINDGEALRAAAALAGVAATGYARLPWPVSHHVYRWNGRIELMARTEVLGRKVDIEGTHEFFAMLDSLGGA